MTFIWPIMLVGLVLVPLVIAVYIGMQQQRRRLIEAFGGAPVQRQGDLERAAVRRAAMRRHIPVAVFLVALSVLIVALARPQTQVSLPEMQGTIILAFDVSGSMAATDIEPTRMDAAKAAARRFIEKQSGSVEIGVVTFSDAGFSTQPPTNDPAVLLAAIERLKPQRGTSIANGIDVSLRALELSLGRTGELTPDEPLSLSETPTTDSTPTPAAPGSLKSAAIVLITDGENTQRPDPIEAAQFAADRGVRIHTIGVGSPEGSVLELEGGFSVRSRLDEATLKQIAEMTGGTYYNARTEEDLEEIYSNLSPELVLKPQFIEVTSIFAGAGILMLLTGGALSLFWLGRVP